METVNLKLVNIFVGYPHHLHLIFGKHRREHRQSSQCFFFLRLKFLPSARAFLIIISTRSPADEMYSSSFISTQMLVIFPFTSASL